MTASRDVAVITPWYPNRQSPYAGAFVAAMVEAVAPGCDNLDVYHCEGWTAKLGPQQDEVVWAAQRKLLANGVPRARTVAGAGLRYIPVPHISGISFAAAAERYAEALHTALGGQPIAADVVHAHVGLRGGFVALRNARPGAQVFVTEHATFLDMVLGQPDSRAMYDDVIARCDGFFAVGEPVRQPLVEAFPQHAAKIQLIPNPIPFDRPRPAPVTALRRWLFMGNLIARKGVDLLLEAFAMCHAEDPSLTLTFIGEGVLGKALRARAAELGIADAVEFRGSVRPDEAVAALAEHDLLVHPSRLETFGMTIVEAIAVGTPVLITRSGGPQATLAGIEEAGGQFVDVTDDPATIADGYRKLVARFPDGLDLDLARHTLEARYGYGAVGAAHHRAWFGSQR